LTEDRLLISVIDYYQDDEEVYDGASNVVKQEEDTPEQKEEWRSGVKKAEEEEDDEEIMDVSHEEAGEGASGDYVAQFKSMLSYFDVSHWLVVKK